MKDGFQTINSDDWQSKFDRRFDRNNELFTLQTTSLTNNLNYTFSLENLLPNNTYAPLFTDYEKNKFTSPEFFEKIFYKNKTMFLLNKLSTNAQEVTTKIKPEFNTLTKLEKSSQTYSKYENHTLTSPIKLAFVSTTEGNELKGNFFPNGSYT